MRLSLLSPNLNIVLSEILQNQKICKLLQYVDNPYSQPDITNTNSLLFEKILPFPFDPNVKVAEGSQLRVYYGNVNLKNNTVIEQTIIHFDVICSKSKNVWLVKGTAQTRPWEIASEIVTHFDKSIGTLGKINFHRIVPFYINSEFDGVRVIADMMTIGR